jgi:glycosyltransferase involved in cell wall biosynthesis
MKDSILFSIITVVYNGEKHLQQTIDSVYNQTYKNIEYIIIDGGSTDSTLDIIENNKSKIDKWISEPDDGLYDAMNKGVALASGDLVGTINSDDWYESNALELVLNAFLKHPSKKLFHADKRCIELNGDTHIKKAKKSVFLLKYHAMLYNHPTMFIHKDIYKTVKYNTQLKSLSDYQLTLEVYLKQPEVFYYLPEVISNFRLGGISAKISIIDSLNENYRARRNAGMSFLGATFAYCFRIAFTLFKLIAR